MCESNELIVGFLYDELTSGERKDFQAHLAVCSECRVELEGLRSTRTHLALWSPPLPDLGFRVISGGSAPAPALPRRTRLAPVFAFAAAAVVVLAAAAAIANVEIRYGTEGLQVRTGWAGQAQGTQVKAQPDASSGAGRAVIASAPTVDPATFGELDRRLRAIEASMTRESSVQLASTQNRMSDAELLRQVRQMLSDAQSRQRTDNAHQMLQILRDVQQQHASDIVRIQQGLDQYQGMTNAEIAQSRDMFNQWIRASARQEK